MKKIALISVCVLGLAFAGSAATTTSKIGQTPVKKEAPVAKKVKKAPAAKAEVKKPETPAAKPAATATQAKPATPAKK